MNMEKVTFITAMTMLIVGFIMAIMIAPFNDKDNE